MAENEAMATAEDTQTAETESNNQEQTQTGATATEDTEEISYHAVEKDGQVTAIWEMQGRKHLRTIDPRSGEGKNILSLFTAEHHDEENAAA